MAAARERTAKIDALIAADRARGVVPKRAAPTAEQIRAARAVNAAMAEAVTESGLASYEKACAERDHGDDPAEAEEERAMTNHERCVELGRRAVVGAYETVAQRAGDRRDQAVDTIVAVLHWARSQRFDCQEILDIAEAHHYYEADPANAAEVNASQP
jgi:hypothetical protein